MPLIRESECGALSETIARFKIQVGKLGGIRPRLERKGKAVTTRTTFLAPILSIGLTGAVALVSVGLIGASAQEALKGTPDQQVSNIRMDVDGTAITATLDDNATARDFASLLPMTLSLDDYNATEKISDLPRRLFTEGAPAGSDPSVEDITYYAP